VAQALLPVRVLMHLCSAHSQECLCHRTFSAASKAEIIMRVECPSWCCDPQRLSPPLGRLKCVARAVVFRRSNGMRRFQRVIADRAARCDPDMNRGSPTLQAVMPGAMKNVGDSDGSCRSRRLDPREQRMVVHNGIREKGFINTAAAKIQCRSIVQGARPANACEQQIVFAIPKFVNDGYRRIRSLGVFARFLLARRSCATSRLRCGGDV
jgi:hypothetical protein